MSAECKIENLIISRLTYTPVYINKDTAAQSLETWSIVLDGTQKVIIRHEYTNGCKLQGDNNVHYGFHNEFITDIHELLIDDLLSDDMLDSDPYAPNNVGD